MVTARLSDEELYLLLKLEGEATPGPWTADGLGDVVGQALDDDVVIANIYLENQYDDPVARESIADALLIAASRNALRRLVEEVRELRAEYAASDARDLEGS